MSSIFHVLRISLAIAIVGIAASTYGQTIIDIPPANSPNTIGADTIVNVLPGGVLDRRNNDVIANDGAVVNVVGGRVDSLVLRSGAIANVESGGVNERFLTEDGGLTIHKGGRTELVFSGTGGASEIRGGAIERLGTSSVNASMILHGVDFAIDGVFVNNLSTAGDIVMLDLPEHSVLTGILADGTPFGHVQDPGVSFFSNGSLTLMRSIAPPQPVPGIVIVDTLSDLPYAGAGQTVQVVAGGRLGDQFRAGPGSRVEVNGGRIDAAFHVIGAEVQINNGTVGRRLNAYDNTIVTINGGSFDGDANFYSGSILNVEGGGTGTVFLNKGATINVRAGQVFEARGGEQSIINIIGGQIRRVSTGTGTINVSGGSIIDSLDATEDGLVEFSGGRHTDNISLRGADMVVRGSNFRVNGVPVASPSGLVAASALTNAIDLSDGVILSGVYADGTPFVLSGDQEDIRGPITLIVTDVAPVGPSVINVPSDPVPSGLRSGQTLFLDEGGALPDNYTAGYGSSLVVRGGTVGRNLEIIGATVAATGGQLSTIDAFTDSEVTIGGNAEFHGMHAYDGAKVNIVGGRYTGGNGFQALSGAQVVISGGEIRGRIEADESSTVNISGGELEGLRLLHFSTATISGGNLDGEVSLLSGSHLLATGGTIVEISATIGDSDLEGVATTTATIDGAQVTRIRAAPFSAIEVLSGIAGDSSTTAQGGSLDFHGGALADNHSWPSGNVEVNGYDFQIDGVPIDGLQTEGDAIVLQYTPGTTLTGILSDGTPFNVRPNDNFNNIFIGDDVLKIIRSAVPTLANLINVPSDTAPYGAAANQTVIVDTGGALGDNFVAGPSSVVEVRGGEVGDNFEADRSHVTVSGGVVGERGDAFAGSIFTISGGLVGERFEVYGGSVLNITGGELGRLSVAHPGSVVNMSGGLLGSSFEAIGATVRITGGQVANEFEARDGTRVVIEDGLIGSNFDAGLDAHVTISGGQIGSSFNVSENAVLDISGGVFDGGVAARGAAVVVNLTGGSIAEGLLASQGATINISGGRAGDSFRVFDAEVNITGGEIGDRFQLRSGAKVLMTGGAVGERFEIRDNAEAVIAGGQFGDLIRAYDGSTVVFEGFGFELDGVPIPGLGENGDSLVVDDRGGALLTGFFTDGTPFEFQLNEVLTNPPQPPDPGPGPGPRRILAPVYALSDASQRDATFDFFAQGATLRVVSSVPEPASVMLTVGLAFIGLLAKRRDRRN